MVEGDVQCATVSVYYRSRWVMSVKRLTHETRHRDCRRRFSVTKSRPPLDRIDARMREIVIRSIDELGATGVRAPHAIGDFGEPAAVRDHHISSARPPETATEMQRVAVMLAVGNPIDG